MNELYISQLCKTLHVMAGIVFLGLTIAQYFYMVNNLRQRRPSLLVYALRVGFVADGLILLLIILTATTAVFLAKTTYSSLLPAWILVAYWVFGLLTLLWAVNLGLKIYYLQRLRRNQDSLPSPLLFHISHSLMILLFVVIIHDAVSRSTFLSFVH